MPKQKVASLWDDPCVNDSPTTVGQSLVDLDFLAEFVED